ncbi:MAG: hypothetical protein ACRETS_04435 [Steroidobacteraceae bacterium]
MQLKANMPKKLSRHKRVNRPMSSAAGSAPPRAHSVKDLLARPAPVLTRVTDQAARANFWHQWLSTRLPAEIRPRVSGVVERDGTLVIFAESAAWSARLRFAVLELEPLIRAASAALTAIVVRVRPRG